MSREKQIEEMAKDFCAVGIPCEECHLYKNRCHAKKYATRAYNAGYRKASEVAREIFEEIEKEIDLAVESNYRAKKEHKNHSVIPNYDNFNAMCDGKIYAMRGLLDFIAELKKKYESEKNDE